MAKVPRRDKANYARARRWRWGDAVIDEATNRGNAGSSPDEKIIPGS